MRFLADKSDNFISLLLDKLGIKPVGIASLIDRSGQGIDFDGIKVASLMKVAVPTFQEEKCPLCQEGMPIDKPGSRKI